MFWERLGSHFGDLLDANFVILDAPTACRIRELFFHGFRGKNYILWEAWCAGNIINITVFNRFHVYRQIEFSMSWASFLESLWEVFGVLGVTFGDFRRAWKHV